MRMKSFLAHTALCATMVIAVAAGPEMGCAEKKGGLMLAVTTDMLAPKDVNVVSVSIQVGPEIKYNFVGRVTPEGEVLLPATLAIVEPDDPKATIRVRVIAFKETKARVLRDIITTSPRGGRIALLRMPLSFINDESATGSLPELNLPPKTTSIGARQLRPLADPFNPYGADVVSKCADPEQTVIDGECASAKVDSSTLPDYSDELVFPGGDPRGACFSPRTCFDGWREAVVDLDACTAPKNGEVTNVALVTSAAGDCREPGKCFVPLDKGDDGWRDEGDRVGLPKGVCRKIREGAKLGFVGGTACGSKTPSVPVCGGTGSGAPVDAGAAEAEAEAEAGIPDNVQVVSANGISGIAAYADRLYYGSQDGLFVAPKGSTSGTELAGSPGATVEPWFVAQHGEMVVFAKGSTLNGVANRAFLLSSAGGALDGIEFASPVNSTIVGAAIGPQFAWFPVFDGTGSGGVLHSAFTPPPLSAVDGLYSMIKSTAVANAPNDKLWVGRPDGTVDLCIPFGGNPAMLECPDTATTDSATPIEAISTNENVPDAAFLLKPDGVHLVKITGASPVTFAVSRLTTDDLSSVDDGTHRFTRGIAGHDRCAYYASKRGLEFVAVDKSASGVLAPSKQGTEVIGVVAPVFPGVTERHIWYSARGAAINGGGIYRVNVPAACL